MINRSRWVDPTINLGHALIVLSLIASVFVAYAELRSTDAQHDLRISTVEGAILRDNLHRRQFEAEVRETLQRILQDLAVLKDDRERRI